MWFLEIILGLIKDVNALASFKGLICQSTNKFAAWRIKKLQNKHHE